MGYRDEFTEEQGARLEGLEGERWKDTAVGDFIRGHIRRASVQNGTTLAGAPEKKMVLVLENAVGQLGGQKVAAPACSLVTSGGRGSALAEALDGLPMTGEAGVIQVHFVGTKPGKETGLQKLWCIKAWAYDQHGVADLKGPPTVVVDMRTWGTKKDAAWSAPDSKVAAV